jgi:hypothetical protein
MLNNKSIDLIQKIITPLYGLKPWSVELGYGSMFTIDFGKKMEVKSGKYSFERGEWHIWVYRSPWRIETRQQVLAGSEDSREFLKGALKVLEGRSLEKVEFKLPSLETTFIFEGDHFLIVFPNQFLNDEVSMSEYWRLFTPDRMVLNIGPQKSLRYVPADVHSDTLSYIDFYNV